MKENKTEKHTNELINESSPYLLQHAHNPVDWKAWNDRVLDEAREKNKLLLISVGYSACHWCHVMEHESFEDEAVAEVMNSNYVCIKVDREERPDIDHVYMNAVQVMTGMGGWPMNVVALPDGRPVWGGTYFKKEQWKDALQQIAHLNEQQPEKLLEYAGKLEKGLRDIQIIEPVKEEKKFHSDFFILILEKWKSQFDHKNGGYQRAPKFMLPNNFEFLLRYAHQNSDKELMEHCLLTLDKISWGGVFDPVEGGFSRYSVDEKWHVPHFEKMLYDNAQLVELYSNAFKITGNEWYREVVERSLSFVASELTDETGAFYSALDADSEDKNEENKEGAYYTWSKEELQELLQDNFPVFERFYNINNFGKWEANQYVLIRSETRKKIAKDLGISENDLHDIINDCHKKLRSARGQRKKPGLDNKSLTSWNAMMISAYVKAFNTFGEDSYLKAARKNAEFILNYQLQENGRLLHSYKNGKTSINGYLEDYAFGIKAFLDLYEATFEENFLNKAEDLISIVEEDFLDTVSGMFSFTSKKDRPLITKTIEISDNVIPASNSVMAKNLFRFGKLRENRHHLEIAGQMLKSILPKIQDYPQSYSNWLDLLMNFTFPFYEIAITGENCMKKADSFRRKYLPNTVLAGTSSESRLPLLEQRLVKGKDLIYICEEGSCQLPTEAESDAMQLISQV
ncbi:thioredoxin domain-containing protein [Pontixanthobacter gangjinensis]|uniref:Thioredoxin domain-containing protein n=1 Tax=Christiangramia aestuarii TaxID=1028746 RepID=A0A7K1LMU5_9FLAO|nr:thioredoxin domain-containing protein [Christiangramia aestuarii]MUP42129.1 thioredoxin domain-containing protein [Christiangramia aestuarii]